MLKNVALVMLVAAVLYLSHVIARVENERYALLTGMCQRNSDGIVEADCLKSADSRTSALWHIYHAITGS